MVLNGTKCGANKAEPAFFRQVLDKLCVELKKELDFIKNETKKEEFVVWSKRHQPELDNEAIL